MQQPQLPDWELDLIEEAISAAETRLKEENERDEKAQKRAVQLDRERGYIRLAMEIDRPKRKKAGPGQLHLFKTDNTLFDEDTE